MPIKYIRKFLQLEASSGIILFIAAFIAICIDNSRFSSLYENLIALPLKIGFGDLSLSKHLQEWINDGLMTIFFLLVGLEIKREILEGELNSRTKVMLPLLAALGGMLFPALIFWAFNHSDPISMRGWAIPTATDIAFSLGILSLLGSRIPLSLKAFLAALAIFDDLGAIIVIAIFYNSNLSLYALIISLILLLLLAILNYFNIRSVKAYLSIGFLLWCAVLNSGIHATLAGVALAFFIPLRGKTHEFSPARHLIKSLHPWVAFLITPLFAFFNAGVSFEDVPPGLAHIVSPVMLGISCGLFFGKLCGVFSTTFIAIKLKVAPMPKNARWVQLFGISLVCGVGFTMSFFVGNLAYPVGFSSLPYEAWVRLGVIAGSLCSGILGYIVLRLSSNKI
jgi:NhaA family Na+:H+ antiporter